jgi:hypothetical protein
VLGRPYTPISRMPNAASLSALASAKFTAVSQFH